MKAMDGKGEEVVSTVGSLWLEQRYTDSADTDEESVVTVADTLSWVLEIGMQDTPFVETKRAKSLKMNLYVRG